MHLQQVPARTQWNLEQFVTYDSPEYQEEDPEDEEVVEEIAAIDMASDVASTPAENETVTNSDDALPHALIDEDTPSAPEEETADFAAGIDLDDGPAVQKSEPSVESNSSDEKSSDKTADAKEGSDKPARNRKRRNRPRRNRRRRANGENNDKPSGSA